MKVSFSDGTLSYNTDEGLSYHNNDDLDFDDGGQLANNDTNAFSKFRNKMQNLQLPTIPSPQTKRKMQEQNAAQNKMKSELRFSQCKTRIMLL